MSRKSLVAKQKKYNRFSTRSYTRCWLCGWQRSVFQDYLLCRICFRKLAHKGMLPGIRKASW